jgi:hypothetical protein
MSTEQKHIAPYWVAFTDGTKGCVEDVSLDAARVQAEAIGRGGVAKINPLPYPASPRLSEAKGPCPSFCHTPEQCIGNTHCRKSYACSE